MSLWLLRKKGIQLPPIETDYSNITVEQLIKKIREFYRRKDKTNEEEMNECFFLELLRDYPVSMCNRHMSEEQKVLIALVYFESKSYVDPEDKDAGWKGFSYDQLSIVFCRSKASIHEAIRQREPKAKKLLADVELRKKAKELALEQLIEEEKQKLRQKNQKKTSKQPNKRLYD